MPRAEAVDAERAVRHQAQKAAAVQRTGKSAPTPIGSVLAGGPFTPPARPTDNEIREREASQEARRKKVEIGRLIDASGVPPRYQRASLFALDAVPADARAGYFDAAERLSVALSKPTLIALIGPRGPGKTWLGCAAVLDSCRQRKPAVYLDALDYLIRLKETYGTPARESDVERRYLTSWLLVLDEMHERGDTAWEDRMLTRLINKRYAAGLATVMISNDGEKEFEQRIGLSIADRIADDGDVIRCNWQSLRGRVPGGGMPCQT